MGRVREARVLALSTACTAPKATNSGTEDPASSWSPSRREPIPLAGPSFHHIGAALAACRTARLARPLGIRPRGLLGHRQLGYTKAAAWHSLYAEAEMADVTPGRCGSGCAPAMQSWGPFIPDRD